MKKSSKNSLVSHREINFESTLTDECVDEELLTRKQIDILGQFNIRTIGQFVELAAKKSAHLADLLEITLEELDKIVSRILSICSDCNEGYGSVDTFHSAGLGLVVDPEVEKELQSRSI